MRLLAFDTETSGLLPETDRVVEIGAALWETEHKRPLVTFGVFLVDDGIRERLKDPKVVEMMDTKLGISPWMVEEFGLNPKTQFAWLEDFAKNHKVSHLVAHNANFDRSFLFAELSRHAVEAPTLRSLPWIDTLNDIPWKDVPDSKKLKYVAADHGFVNPFSHRAVFDCMAMLKVLSNYDIAEVLKHQQKPDIIIRALVPHPKLDGGLGKDKAKSVGFRWQDVDGKSYPMMWVKKIKEENLEAEQKKLEGYQIIKLS